MTYELSAVVVTVNSRSSVFGFLMLRQASERARAPGRPFEGHWPWGQPRGPALIPVRRNNCSWFPGFERSIAFFSLSSLLFLRLFFKVCVFNKLTVSFFYFFQEIVVCILSTCYFSKNDLGDVWVYCCRVVVVSLGVVYFLDFFEIW